MLTSFVSFNMLIDNLFFNNNLFEKTFLFAFKILCELNRVRNINTTKLIDRIYVDYHQKKMTINCFRKMRLRSIKYVEHFFSISSKRSPAFIIVSKLNCVKNITQ